MFYENTETKVRHPRHSQRKEIMNNFLGQLGSFEDLDEVKQQALISAAMKVLSKKALKTRFKGKTKKQISEIMKKVRRGEKTRK